ncbi:MAG TPA: hypothetical protein VMH35_10970 [Streptosporangiaceae bacterium]|nr:hypothetical protein [Streptosporangiaceae bacterium]
MAPDPADPAGTATSSAPSRPGWPGPATRPGTRHPGHLDGDRTGAELWGEPPRSPRIGPVLAVDTSGPVHIPRLAATLAGLLGTPPGTGLP